MKAWQRYAAEFLGTLVLVGIGTGTIIGIGSGGDAFVVTVALAFGLALMTALYMVGRVSGGHFNPAVSLAAFLDKRINLQDMVAYWIAQVAGALTASAVFAWVLDRAAVAGTYTQIGRPVVNELSGLIAEAVFTAVFVFAILVLAKSQAHTKYLGMGVALAAVHFVGIAFTGASVNPARTFAPALVGGTWDGFWVFIVGPALGAVLAWVLYKVIIQGDLDLADDVSGLKDSV
ncbi:MAG: aquaporin [Acidimicrobiia bacterium]|nr:aquaporin [Acidimicrobiia bacterium]